MRTIAARVATGVLLIAIATTGCSTSAATAPASASSPRQGEPRPTAPTVAPTSTTAPVASLGTTTAVTISTSVVTLDPTSTPIATGVDIHAFQFADAIYKLGAPWNVAAAATDSDLRLPKVLEETWSGSVSAPAFGDLNGDGADEAVITAQWNADTNAPTFASGLFVFGVVNGVVQQLASLTTDITENRWFNTVHVEDEHLFANETIEGWKCCPEREQIASYQLSGGSLAQDRVVDAWALIDMWREPEADITFLPGTDHADIEVGDQDSVGGFAATQGQTVVIDARQVTPPGQITLEQNTLEIGTVAPGSTGRFTLPASGSYQLRVTGLSETGTLSMSID